VERGKQGMKERGESEREIRVLFMVGLNNGLFPGGSRIYNLLCENKLCFAFMS
jgi:hypothetical protein